MINKKNDIDGTTNNIILASAKLYVVEHISRFEKVSGNVSCISLKQLIKSGYLEEPVRNVTDDIDISDSKSVKITYDIGGMQYHASSSVYSTSYVKQAVDAWTDENLNKNDLAIDSLNYNVRLLTHEELVTNLGYEDSTDTSKTFPSSKGVTPEWVYNKDYLYWTMSPYDDSLDSIWRVSRNCFSDGTVSVPITVVRPVITLKKTADITKITS